VSKGNNQGYDSGTKVCACNFEYSSYDSSVVVTPCYCYCYPLSLTNNQMLPIFQRKEFFVIYSCIYIYIYIYIYREREREREREHPSGFD
jgi:hypothetical protein